MKKLLFFTLYGVLTLTSCSKTERTTTNTSDVNTTETITECTPLTQEECIQNLTCAIVTYDRKAVAKLVEYPFPQPYPLKPILNEQEFIQYYDRLISPDLCKELQNSTVEDWHQKSWRGVYFKNGEIWIRDKSLMEEDTIDISKGYKLYAINYPNPLQKAALDSLRKIERKIIGLDKNDINAPQACYLSKDSTLLICLIRTNPTDKNAYINIYNRKTAFIPQVSAKILEIEDDNQCLNTYYTALIDNFTLVLSDADCCGRHISESSYLLSLSKTTNSRTSNLFLDSIYHQYNTNHRCNIHLMPTYLHEVAKWW